jgi:hypothetical protein
MIADMDEYSPGPSMKRPPTRMTTLRAVLATMEKLCDISDDENLLFTVSEYRTGSLRIISRDSEQKMQQPCKDGERAFSKWI